MDAETLEKSSTEKSSGSVSHLSSRRHVLVRSRHFWLSVGSRTSSHDQLEVQHEKDHADHMVGILS